MKQIRKIVIKYLIRYFIRQSPIGLFTPLLMTTFLLRFPLKDRILNDLLHFLLLFSSMGFFLSYFFQNQFVIYCEKMVIFRIFPDILNKIIQIHINTNRILMIFTMLPTFFILFYFRLIERSFFEIFFLFICCISLIYWLPFLYMYNSIKDTVIIYIKHGKNINSAIRESLTLLAIIFAAGILIILSNMQPVISLTIVIVINILLFKYYEHFYSTIIQLSQKIYLTI